MKVHSPWICLIIFASVYCNKERVMAKNYKKGTTIGTVLFEKSDFRKHCWGSEEVTVLNSRRMFEDILPKAKVINYKNDQYVELLLQYFHICFESVRKLSIGKTKHLMLKALADTMGGYLQAYILPLTKQSYYAGNIKYRNAKKLFDLFDELKDFLRTNGVGWAKPMVEQNTVKAIPLVITPSEVSYACKGLITYPVFSNVHDDRHRPHYAHKHNRRCVHRQRFKRNLRSDKEYNNPTLNFDAESVIVPLPFLDDNKEPNSIALPFKSNSLQSLYSDSSIFALVKYYIASVKCITVKSKVKSELEKFNKELYDWLQQSVRPHLNNEKWYPAFGGVLRVITSLEESGSGPTRKIKGGTYEMMPKFGTDHLSQYGNGVVPLYHEDGEITFGTTELIIIAVVSALLVWLLVGMSLVCYRFLTKHSDECSPCDSPNTPVAVLYENMDYCKPDTCPSRSIPSRKRILERLKKWYRNKFGRCPKGCQDRYMDEERCLGAINYCSKDMTAASKSCHKKKRSKSTSVSPISSPAERTIFRQNMCYTSDSSSTIPGSPCKQR